MTKDFFWGVLCTVGFLLLVLSLGKALDKPTMSEVRAKECREYSASPEKCSGSYAWTWQQYDAEASGYATELR